MDYQQLKKYLNQDYTLATEKWRKRNAYYYNDILRLLRFIISEKAKILQIGAGDGWLLANLQPRRGVYLALSQPVVKKGKEQYPHLDFVEGSLEEEIQLSEHFDYVLLANILGLVPDVQECLARLHKVCKPATRVVITYYNYLWEPAIKLAESLRLKQKQPIQNWLSSADIASLLDLAGFEIIKEGRRLLFPKYIPLVSDILNRIIAKIPLIERLNFWSYAVARPRPSYRGEKKYSVSVVVPARNERGRIEEIVKRVPVMGAGTEIVFVEGGSTDDTWAEIQRVAAAYRTSKNIQITRQDGAGKGDAIRKGFTQATGDILMILDADLTVPPEDLPRFYAVLASGQAEYAHGTRLVYPMEKEAMRFLNLLGNKFFSLVFSWLLKQRIKDTLCGTKVLFKKDYERIAANRAYFGNFDPFGDFDLIFGASKLGLKIIEIPVHYKGRRYGRTNISRFRHGWLLLKMCMFAARKIE